jgi:hypothetical protein
MNSVESLAVQLKLVSDLCDQIVDPSMKHIVETQRAHFEVLVQGLRDQVLMREEKFQRAIQKTETEQRRLEAEIHRLQRLLAQHREVEPNVAEFAGLDIPVHDKKANNFPTESVHHQSNQVRELSELRDRLRSQIAELNALPLSGPVAGKIK